VFYAGDEHKEGSFSDGFSIGRMAFTSNAHTRLREEIEKSPIGNCDTFEA
jgi:hypothetical protein